MPVVGVVVVFNQSDANGFLLDTFHLGSSILALNSIAVS